MVENVPNPNSSMLVFPMSMPPASLILAMAVASNAGRYPSRILDPAQVSMSLDVRLSLAENRNLASPGSVSWVLSWNIPYFEFTDSRFSKTVLMLMTASAPLRISRRCPYP